MYDKKCSIKVGNFESKIMLSPSQNEFALQILTFHTYIYLLRYMFE